jgi:hypothetical protein
VSLKKITCRRADHEGYNDRAVGTSGAADGGAKGAADVSGAAAAARSGGVFAAAERTQRASAMHAGSGCTRAELAAVQSR